MDKLRLLKIAAAGKAAADAASGGGDSGAATGDPHYAKVIAHFDSANTSVASNQNQSFEDTSTNGHSITVGGNPTSQTSSPYYPPKGYRSVYLPGSPYVIAPSDSSHQLGSGDFTIECFVHVTTFTNYGHFITNYNTSNTNAGGAYFFRLNASAQSWHFQIGGGSGFTQAVTSSTTLTQNQWHHLAVTRSGTTVKLWQDGQEVGSATSSVTFIDQDIYMGSAINGYQFSGYLSNVRIVKGTALYTSAFTSPTTPLTDVSGTGLLCLQSSSIVDESSNRHTLTGSINAETTSFYPSQFQLTTEYSSSTHGGSTYFNADYLYTAATSTLSLVNATDFTIELWFYTETDKTSRSEHLWGSAVDGSNRESLYFAGNTLTWWVNGSARITTTDWRRYSWNHVAIVNSSGTTTFYLNGTSVGTYTSAYTAGNRYAWIGTYNNNSYAPDGFIGRIANVRMVNGTAVYTSDFTLPTSSLTAITNTAYLPKPIIGFEEQTGKRFDYTYYGNAQVINNYHHLQYASYFDGTGDSIQTSSSSSTFQTTSGQDFTIEFWVNVQAFSNYGVFATSYDGVDTDDWWVIRLNATNQSWLYRPGNDAANNRAISSTTLTRYKWHHIAVVRNSGTSYLYQDGQQVGSISDAHAFVDNAIWLGDNAGATSYASNCYIADFRFVVGTAVYTSAFTPPKVPLTAISGTSLLISTDQATVQDSSTNAHTMQANGNTSLTKEINYKDTKTFDIDSSLYFDGVGDYINVNKNYEYFDLNDEDFTIELWFKRSAVTDSTYADSLICDEYPGASIALAINPTGYTGVSYSTSAGTWAKVAADPGNTYGSIQTELEKWYHFAVVRSGTTGYQFINGVQAETWNFGSVTLTDWTSGMNLGKWHSGTSRHFHGEIYGLRMTKGVARYTENFTVPTSKKLSKYGSAASGQGVTLATDAYFANTVFLQSANTLPANTSVDDNETILDKSTNSLTVTLNGDTKIKPFNPYTPVGEWSIDYTKSNSYLYWTNPSSAIPPQVAWLDGASDDGTFECWVWLDGTQTAPAGAGVNNQPSVMTIGGTYINFGITTSNTVRYYWWTGATNYIDTTTALEPYRWHHLALVRSGTTIKIYIDGVESASNSSYGGISWASSSQGTTIYHGVGAGGSNAGYFKGYISNMRSSDNVRYTGTFDPPTEKFTSDANTLYLSHDSNKRKSRDSNEYGLASGQSGNWAEVVSFSPYDSSVPYQNEVGCIEFDGTGDSIDIQAGNHFVTDFGSSDDVTWEGWVYLRASQNSQLWGNTGQTSQVLIHTTYYFYAYGFQGTARSFATELYEWHHIAAVRSSGTVYIYVDGVLHDSGAGTGVHNSTSTMRIGERADGYNDMNGYVADVHWMQGYAKYTSAFTPPASPVAIHSNTVTKLPFNDLSFYDTTENTGLVSSSTDGALAWPIGRHIKYATWHEKNSTTQHYTVAETASNEFTFGTGDVTMECFYFPYYTSQSSYGAIMTTANATDQQGPYIGQYNNTDLWLLVGNGTWQFSTAATTSNKLIMGRWNHVAYTREGNVHRLYCNGEKVLEVTNAVSSTNTNDKLTVGGRTNGAQYAYGWIADVRVVKGTALYTTDYFDVPKEALTEVTNTVFLQSTNSTTLQDSSSNGLSITNTGSVTYVNRKAILKVATTPMIFNGSSYVDLTENKSVTGKFGTQDFTIEAYIMRYPLNATRSSWLSTNNGSFASGAKFFRFGSSSSNVGDGTGKIHIGWEGVGDSWLTSTSTFNDNEWYYFALVREGNTFTMYVNGAREATDTQSGEFNLDIGSGVRLGKSEWDGANGFFSGQISQLRITVGNARYSGAGFVIPDNYFPGKNA